MKKLLLSLSILLFTLSAFSQTGSIKGKITDKKTKETIIGATVTVVGTYFAAPTDLSGNFTLNNIKPGEYSLKVVYLGYKEIIYNGVKVTAGAVSTLNVQMTEVSTEIGVVEVLGQRTIVDLESGKSSTKVS